MALRFLIIKNLDENLTLKTTIEKVEFNPFTLNIKIENLVKVLDNLDADIIALQEIENRELMILLQKKLPKYKCL
mgnify:CR=1 FL=1